MIKVYVATWCEPCKHFLTMLDSNNIKYKKIDIDSTDGTQESREKEIKGIPTIEFNNKFLIGNLKLHQVLSFIESNK